MVRATKPYIVPAADQGPDSFTVHVEWRTQPLTVKLPLSANGTIDVLRPLANHLGLGHMLSPHESKDSLLSLIRPNLSLLPMADAIARWPQLGEPVPTTLAAAQEAESDYKGGGWAATLRETTPEFIPHLHSRMAECKKVCDRLEYEEQVRERDWQELRERFRTRAPAWCMEALRTPPAAGVAHYVITLAKFEQSHDGYCSDGEELRTEEVEAEVLYLPVQTGWTPTDIPIGQEWTMQDECHCCCRAEEKWCVRSCVVAE
jgi:hypothetical protein